MSRLKAGQMPKSELKRLAAKGAVILKPYYAGDPDWDAALTDALTNLRHYCQANGLDFERGIRTSLANFEAETNGEE